MDFLRATQSGASAVHSCVEMRGYTTERRSRSCVSAAAHSRPAVMCLWRSTWTNVWLVLNSVNEYLAGIALRRQLLCFSL